MFTRITQIKSKSFLIAFFSLALYTTAFADISQIQVVTEKVEQGSIVEIVLPTLKVNQVRSISLVGVKTITSVPFTKNGTTTFIIPIDLKLPAKEYTVRVVSITGRIREAKIAVAERIIPKIEFMPGANHNATSSNLNTTTNINSLNNLEKENAQLRNLPTNNKIIWKDVNFIWPLKDRITITDVYGYDRGVQSTVTTHKGLDFRAAVGTPVYSMQRGIVRIAKRFSTYGNTVVIDHGKGIHTLYMHLDSISVKENKLIEQGVEIGKSGQTGYSFGPHLHLSIWIYGISIDPLSFMAIFNKKADEFAL